MAPFKNKPERIRLDKHVGSAKIMFACTKARLSYEILEIL